MIDFLYKIIDFFSPYANSFEKKLDKFLGNLSENSHRLTIAKKVLQFMQEDTVVFQLWAERRYKGYLYLHKKKRRELYENVLKIERSFHQFMEENPINMDAVYAEIDSFGIARSRFLGYEKELEYLAAIMSYFNPISKRFHYRESSNFGALLNDPETNQLIGDCNQIVTLYVHFFSLKFDISNLEIKTPHEHVCLHFRGIDIEATNGHFANYTDTPKIHPITELMAVNLLDTTDSYAKQHEISPKTILESSKLAFLLSSNQELVKNNLIAAYHKIANSLVDQNKFDLAYNYARQSKDTDLLKYVCHNAAVYNLNNNKFSQARRFAQEAKDIKLLKAIDHSEGVYFLNNRKPEKALEIFRRINEPDLIKSCYASMTLALQDKLKNVKTVDDLRSKRSTLYKMRDYANKSQDSALIKHVDDMLSQI